MAFVGWGKKKKKNKHKKKKLCPIIIRYTNTVTKKEKSENNPKNSPDMYSSRKKAYVK